MYNEERKKQFIAEKRENAILSNNIINGFNDAELWETRLGRDLCEWNSNEIIGFYKYLSRYSVQSLVQLNNSFESYTNWCIVNGLVSNFQNHYSEIKPQTLIKCIDLKVLENGIIARDELLREINKLPNYCDKFIILGIFEGISVTGDVMKNVKVSDLNGNHLALSNGITLTISDELKNIILDANDEMSYVGFTEIRPRKANYISGDTVLRYSEKYHGNKSTVYIGTRMRRSMEFLGYENVTIKSLMESGRIQMCKELTAKRGVEPIDAVRDPNLRIIHEKIYGKIQNITTYIDTYGKFFV